MCCAVRFSSRAMTAGGEKRGGRRASLLIFLHCLIDVLTHSTHTPNPTPTTTTLKTAFRRAGRVGLAYQVLPRTPANICLPPSLLSLRSSSRPRLSTQRLLTPYPCPRPPLHPYTTQAGRQCRQATMASASMRAAAAQYINPAVKLSHKTTVIRLYRKSLKTLNAWYVDVPLPSHPPSRHPYVCA